MLQVWTVAACAAVVLAGVVEGGLVRETGGSTSGEAASLNDWIEDLQLRAAGTPGFGAVRVHTDPGHAGNGSLWYQVVPYFANQGLLGYVRSSDPDRFGVVWDYVAWHLEHNEPDGRILNHWYAENGTLEQTCPPDVEPGDPQNKCDYEDASDSYAATFLTLVRAYHEEGGDATRFTATVRQELETTADLLLDLMDGDNLTWNRKTGDRVKYLLDNAEVYEGLRAMTYIEDSVYGDSAAAATYSQKAAAVRAAIKSELFLPSLGAYAVGKAMNATAAQPPDPLLWYWSGPQQLWPILTGVVDATDPQAVQALTYLEHWWGGPTPRNWTRNTVDPTGQLWAAAGYAAHLAGLDGHAATHAEYVLCRAGAGVAEPGFAWPFHVGDAGFLLQSLDAGVSLPPGTFACPPRGAGLWLES